jgi:hypothetical protein
LCNILNQNPRFWATSTSALSTIWLSISNSWSNAFEIKGDLANDRKGTEQRLIRSLRAFTNSWHQRDDGREVIFDKSRGWSHQVMAFRHVYPNSKILVMVRDLREIFASLEKQHRKNPLFDYAQKPEQKTMMGRAQFAFSNQGIVGGPLNGVYDIINRKLSVNFVRYEKLVNHPKAMIRDIYEILEEDNFEHDFENIQNTATDPDAFYLHKFPHEGSGKIEPPPIDGWKEYLNTAVIMHIMQSHSHFNQVFGYR